MKYSVFISFFLLIISGSFKIFAQSDTSLNGNVFELQVEDVFQKTKTTKTNISEIVSVSKQGETTFDVPLGVSVVSKEMIKNSGVMNLAEALRLFPGVFVREVSAGNYDVHVRGMNSSPPASDFTANYENMILVMINNRPVYNYFTGGTFWETLPIDLNDIERIELIRGPSAALYGPNAVNGVINFITRQIEPNGVYSVANLRVGDYAQTIFNTSIGYRFNQKFSVIASGNFGQQNRISTDFYDFAQKEFVPSAVGIIGYQGGDGLSEISEKNRYPDRNLAFKKAGFNTFFSFSPREEVKIDLTLGLQNSYTINAFAENTYTPLSTILSKTQYIDLKATFFQGNLQLSHLNGEQEPGKGNLGSQYKFNTLDFVLDYDFKIGNLFIKPAINFRNAVYDDTPFADKNNPNGGILNARREIGNFGASLRGEYKWKNLRLIGAIRNDKFSVLKDNYLSYQLIATYKIKDKHLLRVNYSKATRGVFMTDVYANYLGSKTPTPDPNIFIQFGVKGNENIKLPFANTIELGYRIKLSDKFSLDMEYFIQNTNNFITRTVQTKNFSTLISYDFVTNNANLKARQTGLMFAFDYNNKKTQLKTFLNIQKTDLQNFTPFQLDPASDPSGQANTTIQYNINNYRLYPSWYGGAYWNQQLGSKWKLNLNAYFFGNHEIWHRSDSPFLQQTRATENVGAQINGKFLLNLKILYNPVKQMSFFINLRNILGQNSYEYYYTDQVGTVFSGGFHFEL